MGKSNDILSKLEEDRRRRQNCPTHPTQKNPKSVVFVRLDFFFTGNQGQHAFPWKWSQPHFFLKMLLKQFTNIQNEVPIFVRWWLTSRN